ncbi:MAG: YegP family protein [Candidatus Nanopelagicales bacterium]
MAGKFELYKDKAGKIRFRLKASNGQIIAVGEAYESKAAAKNGIESVRKNAADAKFVDLTEESATT